MATKLDLQRLSDTLENDYRKRFKLIEKIDLGFWRLFFMRDFKHLPYTNELCYVVDGDSQTIKVEYNY